MKQLRQWLQQPSSVVGVSALLGIVSALLSGQITWVQALPLIAGATASVALPDNAAAKSDAEALASALITKNDQPLGEK